MQKEVSCINSKAVLNYIRKYKGETSTLLDNLDPELGALEDPESFLLDPNNWISSRVACKLLERAKLILNDQLAIYKIAKFAIDNTYLGYIQKILVKAFWSYKRALKQAQKINDKFNRTKTVELVEIRRNGAIVRLHWDPEFYLTKDLCTMNHGFYTFMPLVWGGTPLILNEVCCYFEGAPYCEYHLRWSAKNRFHEIISRIYTSKSVLMETIKEMEQDKKIIEEKYEEVNELNIQLDKKIKQLMAIQESSKAIVSVLNLDKLLSVIMNLLASVCQINRAMIMLVNEEAGHLEYLYAKGFGHDIPEEVSNYKVSLDRVSNILVRVTNTGFPEYISDVNHSSLKKDNILLSHGKPSSLYVIPLITRSKVIGVLATDAVNGKGIPIETRETLQVFAPQIAIAIENARLYTKLQEQMEELKRSHALLSRAEKFSFLGNLAARLAHEIKNPMTAIGTFIQMLPNKYDDPEFRNNFYELAIEETNRVNNLITELLDLAKTKEPLFQNTGLHELIDKTVFVISPQSNEKNIEIVRHYDPSIDNILVDSEKFRQAIVNILSNSIDFTPEGGKIKISTNYCVFKRNSAGVCIQIQDTGCGIAESCINNVFDPYYTTKYRSDSHNGTGLGLFIAHKNIQDHGGYIEVNSKKDKGTTFSIVLPSNSQ